MGLKKPTISNEVNPWQLIATLFSMAGIAGAMLVFESRQSEVISSNKTEIEQTMKIATKNAENIANAAEDRRHMAETLAGVMAVLEQLKKDSHRHPMGNP